MVVRDPNLAIRINQVLSDVRIVLEDHLTDHPQPLPWLGETSATKEEAIRLAAAACRYVLDILDGALANNRSSS